MLAAFANRAAGAAAAFLVAAAAVAAPAVRSDFDRIFSATGEPAFFHAVVLFTGNGGAHRMELWRAGERRIRRDTDGRLTTVAFRGPGAGYELIVLDRERRLSTRVSRDNLYRIGNFTDWFDLGHGLRPPRGRYVLTPTRAAVPGTLPASPAPCRWYDLMQDRSAIHICWNASERFPLLIASAAWKPIWRVINLDRHPVASGWFKPDDRGYVRNDTDRDVESD